jgi:hypothetical protein
MLYVKTGFNFRFRTDFMLKIKLAVFLMVAGSLMPLAAQSAGVFTTRVEFYNGERSLAIIGYNGGARRVVIPAYINGLAVRRIGDSAFRQKRITEVIIPEGVRAIGAQAFFGNQLNRVEIPSSVKEIAPSAFEGNMAGCILVGDGYYNPLAGYDSNYRPSTIIFSTKPGNAAPAISSIQTAYSVSTASSVPTASSMPTTSLTQTVSPMTNSTPPHQTPSTQGHYRDTYPAPMTSGNVNTPAYGSYTENPSTGGQASSGIQAKLNSESGISARAYSNMRLNAITIPEGAKYIGDSAFLSNGLTSIVIPPSVRDIGRQAFMGNALTSITIGENVSLQYDSFRYQFSDYYRMNKYRAGTYILKAGQWVFKGL